MTATTLALTAEQIARIKAVPGLRTNQDYAGLDIAQTLDYWSGRYVRPIAGYTDIAGKTICDCAAGFGWLGFAFLLAGGGKAVLVEPLAGKHQASREIAAILGVADRCEFYDCYMQDLPLPDQSVDIFATVETLEHVGRGNIAACLDTVVRLTRELVLLTTPNALFPLEWHDTRLFFTHWLPRRLRQPYARLLGRSNTLFNDFAPPWSLAPLNRAFTPVSRVMMYRDMAAWRASYPFYSPYGHFPVKQRPPAILALYYRITSLLLGRRSHWLAPNLASVWRRRAKNI